MKNKSWKEIIQMRKHAKMYVSMDVELETELFSEEGLDFIKAMNEDKIIISGVKLTVVDLDEDETTFEDDVTYEVIRKMK